MLAVSILTATRVVLFLTKLLKNAVFKENKYNHDNVLYFPDR